MSSYDIQQDEEIDLEIIEESNGITYYAERPVVVRRILMPEAPASCCVVQ